mgnify:CR=1 FL=1
MGRCGGEVGRRRGGEEARWRSGAPGTAQVTERVLMRGGGACPCSHQTARIPTGSAPAPATGPRCTAATLHPRRAPPRSTSARPLTPHVLVAMGPCATWLSPKSASLAMKPRRSTRADVSSTLPGFRSPERRVQVQERRGRGGREGRARGGGGRAARGRGRQGKGQQGKACWRMDTHRHTQTHT